MFTRCTHCNSVFRVTLPQLQSSGGQVRCGQCGGVFDAFVHLTAIEPTSTPEGLQATRDAPPTDPISIETAEGSDTAVIESEPEGSFHWPGPSDGPAPGSGEPSPTEPATDTGIGEDSAPQTAAGAADPSISPESAPPEPAFLDEEDGDLDFVQASGEPRQTESSPDPEAGIDEPETPSADFELPDLVEQHPDLVPPMATRPRTAQRLAVAAVILLALALPVQLFAYFHSDLAILWPASRPFVEAICRLTGCRVELPRLTDRLVIETSDLQALDPARPNRVVLMATLRNAAPVVQAFPSLELTLTDSRDQVAARRMIHPEEYLEHPGRMRRGMAANAEIDIRLQLETGAVEASGYRIYLFHR
ncbi:MAG: zinc-ribbon domain-containing protein [Betaproteobacteria bacterium]|nr:zinc-ribbon domain-containing protein [Betaproteobacteria bacterium]